jgi:hypothetical protein
MNRFVPALIASVLTATPMHIASAQLRSQTFAVSGTMGGWQYNSITVHFDTRQYTYNFTDGGSYTVALVEPAVLDELVRSLRRRESSPY